MMRKLIKLLILFVLYCANTLAAPVNINTADDETIACSLVGIGIKKAQAIVDYREKNGNFKTIEELAQISGIGIKIIERNKSDILFTDTVTAPSEKQPDTTTESATKLIEKSPDSSTKQFNIFGFTITIEKSK